jgi:hypothetical protein
MSSGHFLSQDVQPQGGLRGVNGVHGTCATPTVLLSCKSNFNAQSIDLGLEMDM